MKKRYLLGLLAIPAVALFVSSCNETKENSDILKQVSFTYDVSDKTCAIANVKTPSQTYDLVIPETVVKEGVTYTVTSVADQAFSGDSGNTYLRNVTLPDTVTTIGQQAFARCTALRKVNLGNGIKTIGNYAFDNCSCLININVPDTCTTLSKGAFRNCKLLVGFDVPSKITRIEAELFSGDSAMIYMTANKITEICDKAFYSCGNFKYAYYHTEDIPVVDGDNNTNYTTSTTVAWNVDLTKSDIFDKYSFQFDPASEIATITGVNDFANTTSVSDIPEKVTYAGVEYSVSGIYKYAFAYTNLESITLPDNIKYANEYSFAYSNIKEFNSNCMTSVAQYAFSNCTSLEKATFTDTVSSISPYAFYQCTSLVSVIMPKNLTSVPSYLFSGCAQLSTVTLYNNVSVINVGAFENCTSLTTLNYTGSEEEWTKVSKDATVVTALTNVTIVYDYTI